MVNLLWKTVKDYPRHIEIPNTLGELVNTVSVNANTADIDMSNFASGIYVVKVISGNQIGTAKITVAR